MAVPVTPFPLSSEGFYAINNQFLLNGPKGFTEFKMLENEDMCVRMDLPGVPEEGVRVTLHSSKKAVVVYADAPMVHRHDSAPCSYLTTTVPLVSPFLHPEYPEDRRSKGPHKFPCGTDPHDPALTGPVLQPHPNVFPGGSNMAYESRQLEDGGLYLRVDMPGVPKDNFTVYVTNGRVIGTGQALAVSHDSSGRFYCGDVATLTTQADIPVRRIKTIAKNGVIRLLIPPV